jgi:DNA-binding CsgD family transcriptional regulator
MGAALESGRESFARSAWQDAYRQLAEADSAQPLVGDDIERLSTAAFMLGRASESLSLLERAHRAYLDAGDAAAALRCAFWIGVNLAREGEMGPASGWLNRAGRLLGQVGESGPERGYLLIPGVFEHEGRGDLEGAVTLAAEAAAIGERTGDADLFALAAHEQGHILIRLGQLDEGLALLDEAMVAVTTGDLSPIVSGIVYCGVILACQDAHEIRRAGEWTAALSDWCEAQPDLVAFTGRCLLHRAEIMQLRGSWTDALEEARMARGRSREAENEASAGEALYRQGEIHRLRGELDEAEDAYRAAGLSGREPQPGLALLRLAQHRSDAAETAMRRMMEETAEPSRRATVLPAVVEVMLAVGDLDTARQGAAELAELADAEGGEWLTATAAAARGAVELAGGEAGTALPALRAAAAGWRALEAPYECGRARVQIGLACRALGDEDTASLELEGARATFSGLGAATELERLAKLEGSVLADSHGLTSRELEVLRCIAAGSTNKAIAADLVLSVRTVDRHVSNIFAKLGVPNRAAAAAFAHEHDLI